MKPRKNILLVDDEKIVRNMLVSYLAPHYNIHPAANAFQALELLFGESAGSFPIQFQVLKDYLNKFFPPFFETRRNFKLLKIQPDLLIIDLKMPNIDGFDFISILRKYLPEVPIFMVTGYDAENYHEKMKQLNINAVLSKPFSPIILVKKIDQVLNSESKVSKLVK